MMISEEKYDKTFNLFLIVISTLMIFRKPCTFVILVFILFITLNLNKIILNKKTWFFISLISLPLLLEILFFWNNDSLLKGFKSFEKSILLFIFPLIILGNFKRVNYHNLLRKYSAFSIILMIVFFIRFIFFYPEYFEKYLKGIHLWEMGYVFAKTVGIHAPALNMHLSFICIICFYFFIKSLFLNMNSKISIINAVLFFISFFFVLFVNTRLALFQTLIGILMILFYELGNRFNLTIIIFSFFITAIILTGLVYLFVLKDPYMKQKYSTTTFIHIDKIGKLDDIKDPQIVVFNALVTRVSIWKSALELSIKNLPFGVGSSDGKPELVKYFKNTNQVFLAKYEFPTHNQYLDFLLKYGILGLLFILVYIFTIGFIGIKTKDSIIIFFFFLFLTSNLTDDYLIKFDGIAFSGFWFSIFGANIFQKNKNNEKN